MGLNFILTTFIDPSLHLPTIIIDFMTSFIIHILVIGIIIVILGISNILLIIHQILRLLLLLLDPPFLKILLPINTNFSVLMF
jgi:hypothetical protein